MQLNTQYQALPKMNEQSLKQDKTLDKIAAGLQLSMEDSASRSIASQLQSAIGTLSQELININDTIAMMQITDGALTSLNDQSQRLNELSVRSNNASLGSAEQAMLKNEFQRTQASMQDIVNTTSYNGKSLLSSNISPHNLSLDNQDDIIAYRQTLSYAQSDIGSTINNNISQANALLTQITQTSAAKSQIADTDIAKAVNDFKNSNQQLDASILASGHQTHFLRESIGRLLG